MVRDINFIKYRENKLLVIKYAQNVRLVNKCMCSLLSDFVDNAGLMLQWRSQGGDWEMGRVPHIPERTVLGFV